MIFGFQLVLRGFLIAGCHLNPWMSFRMRFPRICFRVPVYGNRFVSFNGITPTKFISLNKFLKSISIVLENLECSFSLKICSKRSKSHYQYVVLLMSLYEGVSNWSDHGAVAARAFILEEYELQWSWRTT